MSLGAFTRHVLAMARNGSMQSHGGTKGNHFENLSLFPLSRGSWP